MTDITKEEATKFFAELYGGLHHIPSDVKLGTGLFDGGWYIRHYGSLASYDFDSLTKLVLMAHDKCVRVCISGSDSKYIKISIWGRDPSGSDIMDSHPTIESALEKWRKKHPARERLVTATSPRLALEPSELTLAHILQATSPRLALEPESTKK